MTIDTEINLPPLPGALVDVETEARAYARAAVEADRQDQFRDATKMVSEDVEERPCNEADGCPTEKAVLQRFWRAHQGQPAARAEPVAEVLSSRKGNDTSTIDKALPDGTKLYAWPVAAQAQPTMPPLTEAMRAVLRNEHCVYDSEDALYAALCNAAGSGPSAQDREDDEALADTQRAIIEAAERRGYERAEAENMGYRTDAGRYREFFEAGLPITFLGIDYHDKPSLDAAIDAARAAKGADHD